MLVVTDGMEHKVEFLTGTNNRNFYKDLEEIVSTMEHENEKFSKQTILKHIIKTPCSDMFLDLGMFGQISAKYGCLAYELKGENELTRINFENLIDKCLEGSCYFGFMIIIGMDAKPPFLT